MRESKLIKLLQTLEKKEFGKLGKYVRGPYFTEDESIIRLYDYLAPHYPNFDKPVLNKENVFDHLFPKKKYTDITLRHLRSKLLKIVEQYLIQLHFEQQDIEKKKLLTEIYGKRNHYVPFEKNSNKLISYLENQPVQHPIHLFQHYSLCEGLYFHHLSDFDKHTNYLQQAVDSLEQFYFLERTKLVIEVKNREIIYDEDYEIPLLPNYAPKPFSALQNLLSHVAELLERNEVPCYYTTKKFLFDNYKKLSKAHNQLAYRILANFVSRRMRTEETLWIPQYLEITDWGIKSGTTLINNTISDITYMNFIITCLKTNDIEECERFQSTYQNLLDKDIKKSIGSLADCLILFKKKKYEIVLQKLITLKIKLILHDVTARTILLQTYYHLIELGDSSYIHPLLTACNTFKTHLKRAKISQEKKVAYYQFISILKNITKQYFIAKKPKHLHKITQKLNSSNPIVGRKWLLEQIKIKED